MDAIAVNGRVFNPMDEMYMPGGMPMATPSFGGYAGPAPQVVPNTGIINPNTAGGYNNIVKQTGEYSALNEAIEDLAEGIEQNEPGEVLERFEAFKDAYKQTDEYRMLTANGQVSDKVLNAKLIEKYRAITGQNLKTHLDDKMSGNFVSGFWNGMFFGILDRGKSSTQLKKELLGKAEPADAKLARTTGSVAGGAVCWATIGAGIGSVVPGLGTAAGAIVGGIAGGIVGGISRLWT